MAERIVSRTNPLVKHLRALAASGSYRRAQGQFLCDSPKLLEEALRWNAVIYTVVCTDAAALPPLPASVRRVEVSGDVMAAVSPVKTPQGVLCVCSLPTAELPPRLEGRRYVVLDGVQDPGNVGTVLRTADAFETDGLILLPGCADPYSPKTVRASMGAVFRRPVWQCTAAELKELLARSGLRLYGAALGSGAVDARELDYGGAAIAIGSEGSGLSREVLALCDGTVRIPMSERCESLNAAVAAAVLLWEAYR
ncbi:MAG: RNA methyltransferase [Ruminococcaceae bacterium]|jgi:TrmH family RNA methyltransferase|nr:RNA methyltransferase [Oscillospiraceae bacterium]